MGQKINKIFVLTCLLTVLSIPVVVVSADNHGTQTANDLFEIYDEALLEDVRLLQNEYNKALSDYKKLEKDLQNAEIYNSMLESAEVYQASKLKEIDLGIQKYLKENQDISTDIKQMLYGDWKNLTTLDARYKSNLSKIDTLLEKKNKYELSAKREVDYSALDELSYEVEELSQQYVSATDVSILGDIDNIRYPLNAPTIVTSKYGNRLDPVTQAAIRFHAGLDLRASVGTEVISLFNGVVTHTGFGAVGGYYVRIDHGNGIATYYCHLSEIKCEPGQRVNQYDVIALSGNTGARTTGPHLHLGLYIRGNSVDPEILFMRSKYEESRVKEVS